MCTPSQRDVRVAVLVVASVAALAAIHQLLACTPAAKFTGARAPVEDTRRLSDADVAEAARRDCEQVWYTGDPEVDVPRAMEILDGLGVRVRYWNPVASGTASARTLFLRADFHATDPRYQAKLLRHELTHYCDRRRLGPRGFEERYLTSEGRWALEVRAYVQTVRGLVEDGLSKDGIEGLVDDVLDDMADTYWLHDLDPEQRRSEAKRILMAAAAEPPGAYPDEPRVPFP